MLILLWVKGKDMLNDEALKIYHKIVLKISFFSDLCAVRVNVLANQFLILLIFKLNIQDSETETYM